MKWKKHRSDSLQNLILLTPFVLVVNSLRSCRHNVGYDGIDKSSGQPRRPRAGEGRSVTSSLRHGSLTSYFMLEENDTSLKKNKNFNSSDLSAKGGP